MTTSWRGAVSRLALRTPACAVDAAASLDGAPASSSDDDCCDQGGGAPAGAAPYPSELLVVAKSNAGVYMVDRCAVRCACAACAPLGPAHLVSPTEFERHSGIPAAKKWRFSIKVAHPGEPDVPLGRWLEIKGLDRRHPKRAPRVSPPGAFHGAAPVAAAARAPAPPRAPEGDGSASDGGDGGDADWMRSPRKPRGGGCGPTGRSPPAAAAAPPQPAGVAPPGSPGGSGDHSSDKASDSDDGIRIGPGAQASIPEWRPRPSLSGGAAGAAAAAAAAAAVAADLARAGPRGPSEAAALLMALQERARAESLPPDAVDDLWERRAPALALERGHRQRRAPCWMQGEQFVHDLGGGAPHGHAGRGGRGGGVWEDGLDEDECDGDGSDQAPGAGRTRKRTSSASTHSGTSGLEHQTARAAVPAAAPAAPARRAPGGASEAAAPAAPRLIEWRAQEGRGAMDVAVLLGGQVFVGRLSSRGPLLNWLPPSVAQQRPAAAAAPPQPPPLDVAEQERRAAAGGTERPDGADLQRRCALCRGAAGAAGLGPFMPVQIQNGQLEWVHRECALWSPEVAVDGAGRLVNLATAVRRGQDTTCTRCGRRGATLRCWRRAGCGQELHLPCAREMGCALLDAADLRSGGCAIVACPMHDPSGPASDAAAPGGARDPAAAGAPALAPEEIAAAALLSGIRRASAAGDAAGAAGKRRRGSSEDGSADAAASDRSHHQPLRGSDEFEEGGRVGSGTAWEPRLSVSSSFGAALAIRPVAVGPTTAKRRAAAVPATISQPGSTAASPALRGAGGGGAAQALPPVVLPPSAACTATAAGKPLADAPAAAGQCHAAAPPRAGRCAVCVVQRKGKCGTDSAPKKCMRRQQAELDAAALEQRLRRQVAAQQERLILEQLQAAARHEEAAAAAAAQRQQQLLLAAAAAAERERA